MDPQAQDQSLGTCPIITTEIPIHRTWPSGAVWDYVIQDRCGWPLDYSTGSGLCPIHGVSIPIVRGNV